MTRHADLLGTILSGWLSRCIHQLALSPVPAASKILLEGPGAPRLAQLIGALQGGASGDRAVIVPLSPLTLIAIGASHPHSRGAAVAMLTHLSQPPTLGDLCRDCLLDAPPDGADDDAVRRLSALPHAADGPNLRALLAANDADSLLLRASIADAARRLEDWSVQALGPGPQDALFVSPAPRLQMIDLLAGILPQLRLRAAWFGLHSDDPDPARLAGGFRAGEAVPDRPSSAFARCPGLIDDILNPAKAPSADRPALRFDDILARVVTCADLSPWALEDAMSEALDRLAPCLITPSPEDAVALGLSPDPALHADQNPAAAPMGAPACFFTQHETAPASDPDGHRPDGWAGSVAVVTRTKDRPLLLQRACRSVAEQSWRNFHWVVVNDGGDAAPVRRIMQASGIDPARMTLIDNPDSRGMEAASNQGVRAVDTEFVVIHDDDDQWDRDFLAQSLRFLHTPRAAAAGFEGVLSRAWRVSERIEDDRIVTGHSEPFMPWVSEVPLAQMAVGNFFAPISFLYRRHMFDAIGGYDETLPVLGDWRFNLDFLARANIGFLDSYLSYYHHRDAPGGAGFYTNSVVGARRLHGQYFSVVTNAILRDPATPEGLRLVVANAHQQRILERNLNATRGQIAQLQSRLNDALRDNPQQDGAPGNDDPAPVADAEAPTPAPQLPLADLQHVAASVRRARPYGASPRKIAARLRWERRLSRFDDPQMRRVHLPTLFPLIPSPPDFDHIAYLRDHPEIWATRFNGPGEWLPYHHYLLEGAERGFDRPHPPPAPNRTGPT